MEALSVRDYRNNLSASFNRADEGEQVLIRRNNVYYALVCIGAQEVSLSQKQQSQISEMKASIKRSWKQVKQMQAGELPSKSALSFIDEL